MAEETCNYPGCDQPALHQCNRCRRLFCVRHSEPVYPDIGARSPYRCVSCSKLVRDEARQHTRRSKRGAVSAIIVVAIGAITIVVGTAMAPTSDKVTLAALVGVIIAGIGAISLAYSLFAR